MRNVSVKLTAGATSSYFSRSTEVKKTLLTPLRLGLSHSIVTDVSYSSSHTGCACSLRAGARSVTTTKMEMNHK